MENKISDIARILDKKPSVLLSILRELGVEAPNMNTVLTEEEENRLYVKMGLRQKKKAPVIHHEADPEDDSHIKKTVIVHKKVTVVTKKQYDDHMKNKVDVPSEVKAAKPLHVSKDTPKKEKTTVVQKAHENKEKEAVHVAKPVEKEVKKDETVHPVKEKTHHVKSEAVKETPVKEETPKVTPAVEERRYVKIDKDEINKNKKDYNRSSSTAKADPNRTDFRKPFDPNRTDFRKPFDPNRTDFRKSSDPNRTDFRKPADPNRTDFRKPFDKDKVEVKKSFDRDKSKDDKKPEVTIKTPKNKKGDHKKDFDKAFNKPGTVKKVTKTPVKSEKYRTQTFVPGEKRGVNEILSEEFIFNEYYSNDNIKKRRRKDKNSTPKIEILRNVKLPETMTVKFFAETIKKQVADVIMKLMSLDVVAGINDDIDFDTASLVAGEYKIEAELEKKATEEDILFDDSDDDESDLEKRPPVVVVMGHVDHGKTSLLDTIKKTNVVATEAGSITQHIGAYMVNVKGRKITFLDTPGHEAFTAMRKRGADVTDIAIIVVAADDGIMPQTIEAINHAKAAEVAVIIAINKIDVRGANVDKVMQELTTHGLVPEAWGGDVVCVPVSAKTGENIDNLLDMINLTADILELKANPGRQAKGTIIEARVEKSGVIATLLVKQGTLKVGDAVISGTSTGRIKAMNNDIGQPIESAGPSVPAEILGLDEAPEAGDEFYAVDDLKTAKSLAERRKYEQFQDKHVKRSTSLEDLFAQIQEGQIKDLNIIVKGDVRGSVEAVTDSLLKISNEEVQVKVIHGAVGTITESDISLAEVSNAIIIGFNVRPNAAVTEMAKESGVDIRLYRIIYNAIEDIEAAIKGMLTPKFTEAVKGHAEAREIFKVSNVGTIAGCMVTDGKIERNSDVRVLRDGVIIFEGKLSSLKRFKDDAKEVASGYECGISVEKFNDIKQGDIFETFKMEEIVN